MTETAETPLSAHEDLHLARVWLDALANGKCDEATFVRALPELTRRAPDAGWDLLSLLDQYFRRGKIAPDVFQVVKTRLQTELLGPALDIDISVPMPLREEPLVTRTQPIAFPPPIAAAASSSAAAGAPTETPSAAASTSLPARESSGAPLASVSAAAQSAPAAAAAPVAEAERAAPVAAGSATPAEPATGTESATRAESTAGVEPAVSAEPAETARPAAKADPAVVAPEASPLKVAFLMAAEDAEITQPQPRLQIPTSPPAAAHAVDTPVTVAPVVEPARSTPEFSPAQAAAVTPEPPTSARGPAAPASRNEVRVGQVLRGRYLLQSVIGRGGMGTIFEAVDQFKLALPNVDRRIAVKVLNADLRERPEMLAELRREFQNLQGLAHPNIVRAFEYDRDGDISFFTMEFLSGLSLSRVLAARQEYPLERGYAVAIIRDIGGAVAYLHARGLVHGDLNPGNVFVTDDGELRLVDLAGAKLAEPTVATPRYASCQVLEGNPADTRDDMYSFACIVYLLLTGRHAYGERTAIEARTSRERPPRPPGLSASAWRALHSALAFDRSRRPGDMAEWLKAFDFHHAVNRLPPLITLLRLPQARPVQRRSGPTAVVFVLLALVVGLTAWLVSEPDAVQQASDGLERGVSGLGALAAQARESVEQWTGAPAPTTPPAPGSEASEPTAAPAAADSSPIPTSAPPPRQSRAVPAVRAANPPAAQAAATTQHSASAAPPRRARIEFAASTIDVPPAEPAALVLVRRSGNVRGDASFSWWTESGTAKPGEDFSPIAPHVEHFEDGESSMRLSIPLTTDPTRRQPRSFYVVLSDPSEYATIGDRSLAMVTLPPSDSSAATP